MHMPCTCGWPAARSASRTSRGPYAPSPRRSSSASALSRRAACSLESSSSGRVQGMVGRVRPRDGRTACSLESSSSGGRSAAGGAPTAPPRGWWRAAVDGIHSRTITCVYTCNARAIHMRMHMWLYMHARSPRPPGAPARAYTCHAHAIHMRRGTRAHACTRRMLESPPPCGPHLDHLAEREHAISMQLVCN